MAKISIISPQGTMPGITGLLRPANVATVASNTKLNKKDCRPFRNMGFVNTPEQVGVKQSIYLFGSSVWFAWLTIVDAVKGQVAGDDLNRTYYTGDGAPKITHGGNGTISDIATTGTGGFPRGWRTLGVPAPSAAPTVALGTGGGCSTGLLFGTNWVYRFVTNLGEPGPPSPVSADLLACPNQLITISGLAITPPGGGTYTIAKREIFQAVTGSNGAVKYRLAHTINNAVDTSASFNVTSPLTQLLDSETWNPPPADMHSIHSLPNGNTAGLSGFDVRFAEQNIPHAWPHFTPMDFRGVGLGSFGGSLVIATEGHPYITSGTTPDVLVDNLRKVRYGDKLIWAGQ